LNVWIRFAMKNALIVVSTRPGSGKGGIATASELLLKALDGVVLTQCVVSHDPDSGRFFNAARFLVSFFLISFHVFACRARGISPILYCQVGPRGSLLRKLMFALFARLLFVPVLSHYHAANLEQYLTRKDLMHFLLKILSRVSTRNIALGNWWLPFFESAGVERMAVIPNMVMPVNNIPSSYAINKVVSVSRLTSVKGLDIAIGALAFLPEYVLKIGGDGEESLRLHEISQSMGLSSRVHFLGWLDAEHRSQLYSEAAIFVLPSHLESFGLVYLEALSAGCRVVAGPNPVVMAVLDGLDGVYIASAFSPEAVAIAIRSAETCTATPAEIAVSVQNKYGINAFRKALVGVVEDI
jgi:glycosyltransferase involved in cell wall biosynthesis